VESKNDGGRGPRLFGGEGRLEEVEREQERELLAFLL